jgi:hypothetical protein
MLYLDESIVMGRLFTLLHLSEWCGTTTGFLISCHRSDSHCKIADTTKQFQKKAHLFYNVCHLDIDIRDNPESLQRVVSSVCPLPN